MWKSAWKIEIQAHRRRCSMSSRILNFSRRNIKDHQFRFSLLLFVGAISLEGFVVLQSNEIEFGKLEQPTNREMMEVGNEKLDSARQY